MIRTNDDSHDVQSDRRKLFEKRIETGTANTSRRSLLRIGAVATGAILGGGAISDDVSADTDEGSGAGGNRDRNYGEGNGLGTFLNERAEFKDHPIWTGDIANSRGEDIVDVAVGAMTSVNPPDPDAPPELPLAFEPQVVKVSPGATVRWTWVSNPFDFPIPHDVTSLVDAAGEVVLEPHAEQRFHHFDKYVPVSSDDSLDEDVNPTFEFSFDERGTHLYYCTPHGTPFEYHGYYNLVGMRGAVIVD